MHPVKKETFMITEKVNVDPKGFHRTVDSYLSTDFGLYMARGADHPQFGYLESWLLPQLSLRVSIFHFRPGYEKPQDYYIDIVDIDVGSQSWHTRDLYIDIVSLNGHQVEVLDIDELAEATAQGQITADDAEHTIEATLRAVDGITRHNDDALAWLDSLGMPLEWAAPDSFTLTPPITGLGHS